jgi:thiamine biosynthesis lipoprotein
MTKILITNFYTTIQKMNKKTLFSLLLVAVAVYFLFAEFPDNKKANYQHSDGLVFGTIYSVTYSNPDNKDLTMQIKNALNVVNNSLSMFNAESTISKINNNQPVILDSLFLTVWTKGQSISQATDGAFDMTVAPLVDLWGFGLKNREQVTDAEVDSLRQYIGYQLAVLENNTILKAHPEMRIDAGAIAKGYACDVVADTLEAYGCTDFCVEIGGEIVVKGQNSKGANWHIAINKPIEDSLCTNREIQDVVELTNCGMATSGNYRNYYEHDGKKYSHTIDPRTGYPVQHNLLSATIVAPDCMTADAWATACMVAGFATAQSWINQHQDIKGYLIYEENGEIKTWQSDDFQ